MIAQCNGCGKNDSIRIWIYSIPYKPLSLCHLSFLGAIKDCLWHKGSKSDIAQPKHERGTVLPGRYPQVTLEQRE